LKFKFFIFNQISNST